MIFTIAVARHFHGQVFISVTSGAMPPKGLNIVILEGQTCTPDHLKEGCPMSPEDFEIHRRIGTQHQQCVRLCQHFSSTTAGCSRTGNACVMDGEEIELPAMPVAGDCLSKSFTLKSRNQMYGWEMGSPFD